MADFRMEAVLEARFEGRDAFREASVAADHLSRRLDKLDSKKVEIPASVKDSASADLKDVDRAADRLGGKAATLTARLDDQASGDLKDVTSQPEMRQVARILTCRTQRRGLHTAPTTRQQNGLRRGPSTDANSTCICYALHTR